MADRPKILIIDDERDIVRSLSVRLRAAGYDVVAATDGAAGLDLAVEGEPTGILLDIRMPGMDGLAVLDELKKRGDTKAIPVFVLSANVVEQVRSRALAAGACCFLGKPFQAEKLVSTIGHVLGVGGAGYMPVAD